MNELSRDILQLIGNTSLIALRNIVPRNGSRILLKLESENPTGSIKDRMALAMIEAAEADGRLERDGSVVEYTGGSTGVSLSLVCAVKRYRRMRSRRRSSTTCNCSGPSSKSSQATPGA
jgi:cysteine synthase